MRSVILSLLIIGAATAAEEASKPATPEPAAPKASGTLRQNVGIGLGTIIFEGNDGLVSQISAATTNGTSGNQTFAISSGTSDAEPTDGLVSRRRVEVFVAGNMDGLARDIAAGRGERLDTLAELMAVEEPERPAFAFTLQRHFPEIFNDPAVTDQQVVERILEVYPVQLMPAAEQDSETADVG